MHLSAACWYSFGASYYVAVRSYSVSYPGVLGRQDLAVVSCVPRSIGRHASCATGLVGSNKGCVTRSRWWACHQTNGMLSNSQGLAYKCAGSRCVAFAFASASSVGSYFANQSSLTFPSPADLAPPNPSILRHGSSLASVSQDAPPGCHRHLVLFLRG
jgi:hypothetical protein